MPLILECNPYMNTFDGLYFIVKNSSFQSAFYILFADLRVGVDACGLVITHKLVLLDEQLMPHSSLQNLAH